MNELILKVFESARDASDRVRGALLVMQIACIVVFMAAWHEMPFGWTYARMSRAQAAVWYLDCSRRKHKEFQGTENADAELLKLRHDECDYVEEVRLHQPLSSPCKSDFERTPESPFCDEEIKDAGEFLGRYGYSPHEAREYLKNLETSFVERTITVTVPFLGISLDVNDLSLLGAITFILVLTWSLFSLRREEENLTIFFSSVPDGHLPEFYRLLSTTQVFTIPPKVDKTGQHPTERGWHALAQLLILMPFLVQFFVIAGDAFTLNLGRPFSRPLTILEFGASVLLLVAIGVLTLQCRRATTRVGNQWQAAYHRIVPPVATPQAKPT